MIAVRNIRTARNAKILIFIVKTIKALATLLNWIRIGVTFRTVRNSADNFYFITNFICNIHQVSTQTLKAIKISRFSPVLAFFAVGPIYTTWNTRNIVFTIKALRTVFTFLSRIRIVKTLTTVWNRAYITDRAASIIDI